jgi:phosphonate degradation associated HDIG domain protein
MRLDVQEILSLYETRGAGLYGGEAVTQTEHALQCAALAMGCGASEPMIVAALLHDLGHLVAPNPRPGTDDVHQYIAIPFLRGLFPDTVLEPIRLHVEAKRYLCRSEAGYWDSLSNASRRSLELQGGAFDAQHAERFIARPFARDAVQLRRWDDCAKEPGRATPPLREFEALLERLALKPSPFLAMAATHL